MTDPMTRDTQLAEAVELLRRWTGGWVTETVELVPLTDAFLARYDQPAEDAQDKADAILGLPAAKPRRMRGERRPDEHDKNERWNTAERHWCHIHPPCQPVEEGGEG